SLKINCVSKLSNEFIIDFIENLNKDRLMFLSLTESFSVYLLLFTLKFKVLKVLDLDLTDVFINGMLLIPTVKAFLDLNETVFVILFKKELKFRNYSIPDITNALV